MELNNRPVKNLYDNYALAAENYGDHPLFLFERAKVDHEISYKEFFEYASAMTRAYIHLGLGGHRVAKIGENSPEWIATYLAAVTSGGVAVPIDVALSKEQSEPKEQFPCIHCGRCVEYCPMGLNPTIYARAMNLDDPAERAERLDRASINLCIECGCCSYVCPSARPLVENNRLAKAEIREYMLSLKSREE